MFTFLLVAALTIHDPLTAAQQTPPQSPVDVQQQQEPPGAASTQPDTGRVREERQPREDTPATPTSPQQPQNPEPQTPEPQMPEPQMPEPQMPEPQIPQPQTPQTSPSNVPPPTNAAAGAPSQVPSADPTAGQPLGDGEVECTVGTAPSTTDWSAPLCEWVGDQSCSGCGSKCVINRGVMSIGYEVLGSTLERRDVMSATVMCPALALIARYGEGSSQKAADMSCPSKGELVTLPTKLTAKTPLPLLKRWPHISKRIHQLIEAKAVGEYVENNCRQSSLTFQPMIQVFSGLWGIIPEAAGNNSSPICGDLAGNWLQIYVAESQCITSPSARDDLRSCLGDDSKWLDHQCVFFYLDIALGRTKDSFKAEQYGPRYINALRSLEPICAQRTSKTDCESDAMDRESGKVWKTLVGPESDRIKLWNTMAAATPSYGTPDDNLIKPGEPNPLQVWLSAAPGGSALMAMHVALLAAFLGAMFIW